MTDATDIEQDEKIRILSAATVLAPHTNIGREFPELQAFMVGKLFHWEAERILNNRNGL